VHLSGKTDSACAGAFAQRTGDRNDGRRIGDPGGRNKAEPVVVGRGGEAVGVGWDGRHIAKGVIGISSFAISRPGPLFSCSSAPARLLDCSPCAPRFIPAALTRSLTVIWTWSSG